MEIIVLRDPGDQEGAPIFDPLLSDTAAAISRGKQELDDNSGLQEVVLDCVFRVNFRNGQLVLVIDQLQGVSWRGKVVGVNHRSSGNQVVSKIRVRR